MLPHVFHSKDDVTLPRVYTPDGFSFLWTFSLAFYHSDFPFQLYKELNNINQEYWLWTKYDKWHIVEQFGEQAIKREKGYQGKRI
jgi:hypothetical protein